MTAIIKNIIWKVRVITLYMTLIIVSICFFPVMILAKCINISAENFYAICRLYARTFIYSTKYICGIGFTIQGLDNLPNEKSMILVNHQSFWDNLFMPAIFPMQSWIMKKELLHIPIFGAGLKMANPIAIDRTNMFSVKEIIKQGVKKFSSGLWVVIFPEGTRLYPGETKKFKPSGVKLAQEAGVPIVMVAHNSGLFWPKGFWIKKPGNIQVIVSKPITKEECISSNTRDLNAKVEKWINRHKDILCSKIK